MEIKKYVLNNEKLSNNIRKPFINSSVQNYNDKELIEKKKKEDEEILKQRVEKKFKEDEENYIKYYTESDVKYKQYPKKYFNDIYDLNKRKNKIRNLYDNNAQWDYHGLRDKKNNKIHYYLNFNNKNIQQLPKEKSIVIRTIDKDVEGRTLIPKIHTEIPKKIDLIGNNLNNLKEIEQKLIFK